MGDTVDRDIRIEPWLAVKQNPPLRDRDFWYTDILVRVVSVICAILAIKDTKLLLKANSSKVVFLNFPGR